MRYTFRPDDCMVITIPLGSIKNGQEGQLMPNAFTCRFKDTYKVFQRGRPKALGAAQIITAVFILCLGAIFLNWNVIAHSPEISMILILPSILYVVCGTLTIITGHTPLMPMMKVSFTLNILGLSLAVAGIYLCLSFYSTSNSYKTSLNGQILIVISVLHAFEFLLSMVLIHWESKAVCRAHFNTLPMITLKQEM